MNISFLLIKLSLLWPHVIANYVSLNQGILKGTKETSYIGKIYNAYYLIPYAKPPLGPLRFKPPEGPEPWHGLLNATVPSNQDDACVQVTSDSEFRGTEDCLKLDIFTPNHTTANSDFPIFFYIYGGGFTHGYGAKSGPDFMMNYDVIIVRPSYRVGIHGMISTGDAVISGNMGFKDLCMALKWVKKNIKNFGGDPWKVTLQGHSSAASTVELLNYSPLCKGLFQRSILMSGLGYGQNLLINQVQARNNARLIAQMLKCKKFDSSQAILQCLVNETNQNLVDVINNMALWPSNMAGVLGPVLENPDVEDPFLTEIWWNSEPQPTNVSWLIGHTSADAASQVAMYMTGIAIPIEHVNKHFSLYIPSMASYIQNTRPNVLNFITLLTYTHYFGDEDIAGKTIEQLVQMLTDLLATYPTLKTIHQFGGTKFVYMFNYRSNFSMTSAVDGYDKYLGPAHVDDLALVYRRPEAEGLLRPEDYVFGNEIVKRHVNFGYSGNPNQPYPINESIFGFWTPSISPVIDYLFIDNGGSMKTGFRTDQYEFLSKLPLLNNFD